MADNRFHVQHEPEQSRYVLIDRGEDGAQGKEIGEERYLDVEGADRPERILHHTVVSPDYGGQGLASVLVKFVVEDAIASGLGIVPVCPYVARWLPKHPEYGEHVVAPTSAHLAELRSRLS